MQIHANNYAMESAMMVLILGAFVLWLLGKGFCWWFFGPSSTPTDEEEQ